MIKESESCACKGIRTCALCEPNKSLLDVNCQSNQDQNEAVIKKYILCLSCGGCRPVNSNSVDFFEDLKSFKCERQCDQELLKGIKLVDEFVNEKEEEYLWNEMNKIKWIDSQSGRFKQDYGPKANFKKKKLKTATFVGLPSYSRFFVNRVLNDLNVPDLDLNFKPVELCNLKYEPSRGASIDPHFDDFWLWGEFLITLNILSDTFLTMSPSNDLESVIGKCEVYVPLERRSLIFVYGDARYKWLHAIKPQHIRSLRVAITLRELTEEFKRGDEYQLGHGLETIAMSFKGISVGEIEDFKNANLIEEFNEGFCLDLSDSIQRFHNHLSYSIKVRYQFKLWLCFLVKF